VRSSFEKSDLFSAVSGRFDVITANPPYIRSEEIGTLDREVREHEPAEALDGGPDGLDFYRRILEEAASFLVPGGCLVCEIGYDQGESVLALYKEAGFHGARICRDLSGRDRVIIGARDV
jgi:release factor glutamine methyltransferase